MTGRARLTDGLTAPSVWLTWLDDLDDAAVELERQLAAGERVGFPNLPPPPLSDDQPALPPVLAPATRALLDRLEILERRIEARQETVRHALATLARPRPRAQSVASYELGAALDVAG